MAPEEVVPTHPERRRARAGRSKPSPTRVISAALIFAGPAAGQMAVSALAEVGQQEAQSVGQAPSPGLLVVPGVALLDVVQVPPELPATLQ